MSKERIELLEKKLVQERMENLWAAYYKGLASLNGTWDHQNHCDAQYLLQQCGMDTDVRLHDTQTIINAIPKAAEKVLLEDV